MTTENQMEKDKAETLQRDMAWVEKRNKQRLARKAREQALRDLGLVKVKGALGGTYWE